MSQPDEADTRGVAAADDDEVDMFRDDHSVCCPGYGCTTTGSTHDCGIPQLIARIDAEVLKSQEAERWGNAEHVAWCAAMERAGLLHAEVQRAGQIIADVHAWMHAPTKSTRNWWQFKPAWTLLQRVTDSTRAAAALDREGPE